MPSYDFSNINTVNYNGNEVYEVRQFSGGISQLGYQKILTDFNAQGGTPTPSSAYYYANRTYGSLPSVTRTNYSFNGWFTASSGGSQITTSSTVANTTSGNPPTRTLYAQWTSTGYTLSFNDTYGDFFAQTNSQTIPIASTLHATVSMSYGYGDIYWDKNGTSTTLFSTFSYVNQTLSFAANNTLSFIFYTDYEMGGTITLRLNNASGQVVDTFNFGLTG